MEKKYIPEAKYSRTLIEASLDPLVTINSDGKLMDVNDALIKITGIQRENLIDTDFSLNFTEPKKAQKGYLEVLEKGFIVNFPLTIKHETGKLTDVLYNASGYKDSKGNILGVFASIRDVTSQKQASQYARSLIEASLDPLVTISASGKITDVNEASIKVTGVSRENLIDTDFSNYFTEPQRAQEGYEQVFEKGFVSDYPLTIKHKNGNLTDVLYNASVYKDSKGDVLGVFAAARDVTEQKWAKDLRIANKELAFQNDEKEKRAAELAIANKELAFQNDEKEKRAAELVIANKELAFQNDEKEKRATELGIANKELAFQNDEKEKRAAELDVANKELAFQNNEKEKRATELGVANKELAFQNNEKEKRAAELVIANKELAFQNDEKEKRAAELAIANKELAFQNDEKEKRAAELVIANKELAFQNDEKEKRATELGIANKELAFQNDEKEKRATELGIANKELAFQNDEKEKRATELVIANKELAFQNDEKEKRATELGIANKELAFQNDEKEKRAAELGIANNELKFQNEEKEKRAAELGIANKELAFQNDEKEERATELGIANKELAFQNDEKEKRAAELVIANKELAFQNDEKEKRATELGIANKELAFQNDEKEKRAAELVIANKELAFQNDEKEKRAAELGIANKELVFQNEEKEKRAAELGIANKELNQSERLLKESLKEVSDYKDALDETTIIALTDQKGIIRKVNSNFCKISKYSEGELIGQDHRILNSGNHPKEFIRDLWGTIANGKIWKGEIKNKAKDGTFYWVDTAIVPFLNEQGKPYQYLAIRVDITKRKESEEQLTVANIELAFQNDEKEKRATELGVANKELAYQNDEKEKRAAELVIANKELAFQNDEKEKRAEELIIANKELLAFTYISSHDLQEPLRKIQTFVTIILENENKNLSDNGKYNFERMQIAAGRMQQLIDDLLAFSRVATTELKFEKTELNQIIEEVKAELKDTILEKHGTIEIGELGTPNLIAFQFRQLMYNLISNALKFSNPDVPSHIIITNRIVKGSKLNNEKLSQGKTYYHITVKDNGIGFEPHFSERIFGVFQKLHGKEVYAGTGIGLAIVKKIVENHNGYITATGELKKGASFDIYIPSN